MRRTAVRAMKKTAAAIDRLLPSPAGLTVLIYHRVGRRTTVEVDLPAWLFGAQMAELGSRAATLDNALADSGTPHVVVTFDDGTADFVDIAVPILVEHNVPALLYLATSFIEDQRAFPDDGRPASWTGLRDALTTGLVTIGSHTHTHALLDRVDGDTAARELDASIGLMEDRLGVTPLHFAYPKAVFGNAAAQREVRDRFRSAAVAGTRTNAPGRFDPYRLSRSPIQVSDGMRWWRQKVEGGMRFEDDVRRLVNRRRYRTLTT